MRFYFDRHGKYRGFSAGALTWLAVAAIFVTLALALGYNLFLLAPFIGLWALVIWLYRGEFRRRRARRAGQPQ